VTFNTQVSKEFAIRESMRLRFGADMFNFFNHTNLSGLVTNVNNRFFGELQGTEGARQIQVHGRLMW
jgi:hypothetical protein